MFTYLRLKNFKAWHESGEVELAPVTMLLGANSSGKSSLLQSLLLLKQTAASPDRSIHLNLGGDEISDYFNFGNFDDVLTRGAQTRQFEITFGFNRPKGTIAEAKGIRPPIEKGSLTVGYAKTSAGAATVDHFEICSGTRTFKSVRREKGAYSLFVDGEEQTRGKSRTYAPERSIALSAEAALIMGADGGIAEDISLAIRRELESISYLGPLRRKPERDYVWNKSKPGELGVDGSSVMNALLASSLLRNRAEDAEELLTGVSQWLRRMGVAEKLELLPVGRSSRYELVVHKDGVAANLRDVGIGVSQVLPVLTLKARYVIDTNVFIAASAVFASSTAAARATPAEPHLRRQVWQWLTKFESSDSRLVLDRDQYLLNEYYDNLRDFNDYGRQVIIHKWSTSTVDDVDIRVDQDGHGVLDEPLQTIVHDCSDRKVVAAAIEANRRHGPTAIANASDTDWYGWECALVAAGVEVEQLLADWCRAKYLENADCPGSPPI